MLGKPGRTCFKKKKKKKKIVFIFASFHHWLTSKHFLVGQFTYSRFDGSGEYCSVQRQFSDPEPNMLKKFCHLKFVGPMRKKSWKFILTYLLGRIYFFLYSMCGFLIAWNILGDSVEIKWCPPQTAYRHREKKNQLLKFYLMPFFVR